MWFQLWTLESLQRPFSKCRFPGQSLGLRRGSSVKSVPFIKLPRWFLGATKLKCNLWPVPQEGQSEMRLICRKFIFRLTSVEEWRKWGWANSHNKCFSGSLQTSSPNMGMGSDPVTPLTGLELDVCCYWKGGWPCWSPFSSAAEGRQLWE